MVLCHFTGCCETFPVCCETFPTCCETFPVCHPIFSVDYYEKYEDITWVGVSSKATLGQVVIENYDKDLK